MKDLENTFSLEPAGSISSVQKAKAVTKKQGVTTLLDITRANNIGVSLRLEVLDYFAVWKAPHDDSALLE